MWPFHKPEPVDTTTSIILGDKEFFLEVEQQDEYLQAIDFILEQFKSFIIRDIRMGRDTNQSEESLLSTVLKNIDVKYLALENNLLILTNAFKDTIISKSGTRFLDTIVQINLVIPTSILEAITGKFLKVMLYGLTENEDLDVFPLPTKEEWYTALLTYPWIPLLPLFQRVYDENEDTLIRYALNGIAPQIVQPNIIQGGSTDLGG